MKLTEEERKLIEWWKKANGVSKVGVGGFHEVKKRMGLKDERVVSEGIWEGNFSEWKTPEGYYAYTLMYDPLWGDSTVCWVVKGRRNHAQLIRMWRTFARVFFSSYELKGTKRCWECGREFTFYDIETHSEEPWRAFEERLEYWYDDYCGCGG